MNARMMTIRVMTENDERRRLAVGPIELPGVRELLGDVLTELGGSSLGPELGASEIEPCADPVVGAADVEVDGAVAEELGDVGGGGGLVGGCVGVTPSRPLTTDVTASVVCPTVVNRPETVLLRVTSRLVSSTASRFPRPLEAALFLATARIGRASGLAVALLRCVEAACVVRAAEPDLELAAAGLANATKMSPNTAAATAAARSLLPREAAAVSEPTTPPSSRQTEHVRKTSREISAEWFSRKFCGSC
jgi:hypothetical protein